MDQTHKTVCVQICPQQMEREICYNRWRPSQSNQVFPHIQDRKTLCNITQVSHTLSIPLQYSARGIKRVSYFSYEILDSSLLQRYLQERKRKSGPMDSYVKITKTRTRYKRRHRPRIRITPEQAWEELHKSRKKFSFQIK